MINRVDRYKLLSADKQATKTAIKAEGVNAESLFLKITYLEKGYKAELLNIVTELENSAALDSYLSAHKGRIDANKILLYGPADLPYESFKPLLDVLKKHELYSYKMVPQK